MKPACPPFKTNHRKIGWGGRIRTFTILINSEVSYRLDHAPAVIGVGSAAIEYYGEGYLLR